MGFMDLFTGKRRKQNKDRETIPGEQGSELKESRREGRRVLRFANQNERNNFIKDNCETILDSNRQIEEAKVEYQAVTSYLTDMQKIDMIPAEQREVLEDAAKKIVSLTQERNRLQKKTSMITDRQFHLFERYEDQILKEMPSIKDSERRQVLIQQDIEHLEKEREALSDEQDEIVSKQAFLKGISVTTSIIVVMLFGLFAILSNYSEANLTLPFILTVIMGMASAFYIFMEARKNSAQIKVVQLKQNRQIMLMNKVVIKSVNNRNYLEYAYNKYMVENYEHMKKLWDEYLKAKEEEKRYQNNTELLEFYNKKLINELKSFDIKDSEIWIYQPGAILDNREMMEVRHRLNIRRQKLRERIDTNNKQRDEAYRAINDIVKMYPESEEDVEAVLRKYRIDRE